jgi:acetolactate synthase I/II/III large subunit
MKTSDYIALALRAQGVRHVFQLSGGMIAHLLDSIDRTDGLHLVTVHHEQAAAFAADAVGRLTGRPGVAMATSGPGATNLLTGIGSCYFDSSPAVFLTGQVNRNEQKRDRPIRQLGFQEADIVTIATPLTKAAWRAGAPEDIPDLIRGAFELALSSRPGPVLVDIPMDVQCAELRPDPAFLIASQGQRRQPDPAAIHAALDQLHRARRPMLLIGGGVRASGAASALRLFAEKTATPAVHSLMASDVLPFDHPLRVGFIGTYGNRWANLAASRADLLLVLGSRLDVRQTGSEAGAFARGKTVIQVDCEAGEIGNRVPVDQAIVSDIAPWLEIANAAPGRYEPRDEWIGEIAELRRLYPDTGELKGARGINPNCLLHSLTRFSERAGVIVSDVGQHQMWAAQSLDIREHQRFITSGGMGAMGFALPAAIGAGLASDGPVLVIAGDGGFQVNIQELETVRRLGLELKIVVLNNHCHGMVRQFQESYFDGRYPATLRGYTVPPLGRIAGAYGIPAASVSGESEIEDALAWLWSGEGPAFLEVAIDTFTKAYPKTLFGRPLAEMEPPVSAAGELLTHWAAGPTRK